MREMTRRGPQNIIDTNIKCDVQLINPSHNEEDIIVNQRNLSQGVDSNSSKGGPVEVNCNHSNKSLNSTKSFSGSLF